MSLNISSNSLNNQVFVKNNSKIGNSHSRVNFTASNQVDSDSYVTSAEPKKKSWLQTHAKLFSAGLFAAGAALLLMRGRLAEGLKNAEKITYEGPYQDEFNALLKRVKEDDMAYLYTPYKNAAESDVMLLHRGSSNAEWNKILNNLTSGNGRLINHDKSTVN